MPTAIPDDLPPIGPALLARLRAHGIRTNFDILYTLEGTFRGYGDTDDPTALHHIPGVDRSTEAVLRAWAMRHPLSSFEQAKRQRALEAAMEQEKQAVARRAPAPEPAASSGGLWIQVAFLGLILFVGWLFWNARTP